MEISKRINKITAESNGKAVSSYYFIAIGGVGMSGLAKYLLENGCEVSGSDIVDSKYIDRTKGGKCAVGCHCSCKYGNS